MKVDVYEPLAEFAGKELETGELKMEIDFISLQKQAD